MKLRTDFVTNSSSSSFIYIDIKSEKLKLIMEKYSELLETLKDYICCEELEAGEGFSCREDEGGYADIPNDKDNIIDTLIIFFEEFTEYCDDFEEQISELIKELEDNKEELTEDITEVEWTYGDVGWGGDSESRYEPSNYDEDMLDEIYEEIMAEKGYTSKEEITDYDFNMHVGDQTSNEETSFVYNKKEGINERTHSFELL